jgi:adenylylsulfate kinase-like enzyme
VEAFVDCPPEICAQRDPKGLYQKAKAGAVGSFTGVSDGYEPPEHAEIVVKTAEDGSPEESAEKVLELLRTRIRLGDA